MTCESIQESIPKIGELCIIHFPDRHKDASITVGGSCSDIAGWFAGFNLAVANFPQRIGDVVIVIAVFAPEPIPEQSEMIYDQFGWSNETRVVIFSPTHKCLGWVWMSEIARL